MRRVAATKSGPAFGSTPFIATIAVPQKKNGEIRTRYSHVPLSEKSNDDCFSPSFTRKVASDAESMNESKDACLLFRDETALDAILLLDARLPFVLAMTHSTSVPVPMHSTLNGFSSLELKGMFSGEAEDLAEMESSLMVEAGVPSVMGKAEALSTILLDVMGMTHSTSSPVPMH